MSDGLTCIGRVGRAGRQPAMHSPVRRSRPTASIGRVASTMIRSLVSLRVLLQTTDPNGDSTVRPTGESTDRLEHADTDAAMPPISREVEGDTLRDPDDRHPVDYVDVLLDRLDTPASRIVVGGLGRTASDDEQPAPSAMGGGIAHYPADIQDAIRAIAPDSSFTDD